MTEADLQQYVAANLRGGAVARWNGSILHPAKVPDLSVGTDSGLALRTRKGTGYYKVPSLKGVWYRGHYLSASEREQLLAYLRTL